MAKRNGGIIGPANIPTSSAAAGVWRLRDAFNSIKNGTWPLTRSVATNSARFSVGSTDSLSKTAGTFTSRTTFTVSAWVKLTGLGGVNQIPIVSFDGSNQYCAIRFSTSFTLDPISYQGATTGRTTSSAVYRDYSAWYHVLVAIDSTQATAANRIRSYINGSEITSFSSTTYPTQNTNMISTSMTTIRVGAGVDQTATTSYYDGYISEINYVDGQQLTPSSFGASNSSGVWYPIAYQGTYGTNGFYLKFANSASLGTDSSGNTNNFTVNNLTSVDQSTDTELNNFATLNSLFAGSYPPTFSEGNLKASGTTTQYSGAFSTIAIPNSGKWYCEFKAGNTVNGSSTESVYGAVTESRLMATSNQSGEFVSDGITIYGSGQTVASGNIIGVTIDRTSAELKIYKNNSLVLTKTSLTTDNLYFYIACFGSATNIECNFGNPPYSVTGGYTDGAGYGNFSYAVPSGYYALCTKNLNTYG